MELAALMVDTKSVWMDFPGLKGFKVEIAMISRKELKGIRKSCVTTKFNRKTKVPEEILDEDKFVDILTEKTLKNWSGLTLKHLSSLILVDVGTRDLDEELEYSKENATLLVTNSSEFDEFLNESVFDLENFRS